MANCITITVAFTGKRGKKIGGPRPTLVSPLPLNKHQMFYKWRQSWNHCSLAFWGRSALNLFSFYCGDFGSLECAAVPDLGCTELAPVPSLPLGHWEFFITLLCCRLGNLSEFPCCFLCVAPCFPGSEWLGGSLAWYLCAPGEHLAVEHCTVPMSLYFGDWGAQERLPRWWLIKSWYQQHLIKPFIGAAW